MVMSPNMDDTSWAATAASETPEQEDSHQTLLWEAGRITGVRNLHYESSLEKIQK